MVVDKNDVTFFTHPDAKRQDGFSDNVDPSGDSSKIVESKSLVVMSNSLRCVNTRFFYGAAVDRKCVEGLLARGKKASVVAKQVSRPIKVNSRVFVAGFERRSANTSVRHHTSSTRVLGTDSQVSGTGVLGDAKLLHKNSPPSIVVGQDNAKASSIVSREPKSRTSGPNKRGGNYCSALDNGVNGHIHDAHNDTHNGSVVLMNCKNNGLLASNIVANNLGNNGNSDPLYENVNNTTCDNSSSELNIRMARQGMVTSDNMCDKVLLYDVNLDTFDENVELSNAMLLKDGWKRHVPYLEKHCSDFRLWKSQTDYTFGFVPLNNLVMPRDIGHIGDKVLDPVEQVLKVRSSGTSNFLAERIPVESQLNVSEWKKVFKNYWDQQLVQLVEFGFPLDFNRNSVLHHNGKNHSSAIEFPDDIRVYLNEEIKHGAIMGPYDINPIPNCHVSPFMTREKPNAPNRRMIIDLSWPKNASVNMGVDKNSYLGSEFSLTFPTIDDITKELVKNGPGCHIYKIDVSRAFRHLKIDPGDYDLLGLRWDAAFFDTCLPFGSRHGSQNSQRVSDAVRYALHSHGYRFINYIDDFFGYGTPDVARRSYDCLHNVIERLGLTISEKKLVVPTTSAVCLGVLIDTVKGTVAIPDEKMRQIRESVIHWQNKATCSKRQLQSLLGQLLYIHKCVRPARIFLNRMLDLLRQNYDANTIKLTQAFVCR